MCVYELSFSVLFSKNVVSEGQSSLIAMTQALVMSRAFVSAVVLAVACRTES